MKLRLTFKDPDGVYDSIVEAIKEEHENINKYELEDLKAEAFDKIKKWIKWGEYVTIEIDTDAGTAVVTED